MPRLDQLSHRTAAARRVAREVFGARIVPFFVFAYMAVLRTLMVVGTGADRLFYGIRKVEVEKPIVIVGNHRTGSTFLQRFLHDNGFGSGMALYQLLFPSLVLQFFLRPFLPLLEAVSPTRHHSQEIHKTGLTIVETDDAGMTFRFFDGFFLYGFILAFLPGDDVLDQFMPEHRDTSARDWPWLRELWRRNLLRSGHTRVISKLFSATPMIPDFQQQFPDAKVLYLARDPINVIPSTMSLLVSVLSSATNFWDLPEETRSRYFQRVYRSVILLMRRFHDHWTEGRIDRDKVLIVRFDRLMQDFETMMDEICDFCELDMTDEQRRAIAARGEKQRAYESKHKYDLARFGLSEEQIRQDCAFFYDTFLPPLEATPVGATSAEPAAEA